MRTNRRQGEITNENPFVGSWTYRSLLNDPDINKQLNDLEFGRGTIVIEAAAEQVLQGIIGGPGWSLKLHGSRGYGSPMQVRFQGKGRVGGEEWIYDYIGWLVPVWPNRHVHTAAAGDRRLGGAHDSALQRERRRGAGWRGGLVLRGSRGLRRE